LLEQINISVTLIMTLLSEDQLIWSSIVANSSMNRKRQASGINSYEQDLKFKPEIFLEEKIKLSGSASWLDLCCGEGNALIQTAHYFNAKGMQQNLTLTGIDLIDSFQPIDEKITCLQFHTGSVVNWKPNEKYDLITCCHGIHYAGDKLKVIQTAIGAINSNGMLVLNLDLANIIIAGKNEKNFLINSFKIFKIDYNTRTKILKRTGIAQIDFSLFYTGADDSTGPNYSGQNAVASHYSLK
jgi:SAM-dependent methyltransferase